MREESERFRRAMGRFATGVTLVMASDPAGDPVGLTVNSVASVSLDPLLLLVCMDQGSASLAVIRDCERFSLSILRLEQEPLARRFSSESPGERFRGLSLRWSPSGLPFLVDPLAWMECRVRTEVEAGDHSILIGEVIDCGVEEEGAPLVFFRRAYGSVAP